MILRTSGDPLRLAPAARAEIARVDPSLPVSQVRTMDDVVLASQSRPSFLTLLLSVFSAVALILAAFGIYGVMSYSVEQRVNESARSESLSAQRERCGSPISCARSSLMLTPSIWPLSS
jgi:putative ABC transport system permease protein